MKRIRGRKKKTRRIKRGILPSGSPQPWSRDFSDTVLLESGWIRGGDLIADRPAIVEVRYGEGRIDLIGIGVQRRGQPHGTFRILFNAIARSTLPEPEKVEEEESNGEAE